MFSVTEASAIRAAHEIGGELSAAPEVRRLFPGIIDDAKARACAAMIMAWRPLPDPERLVALRRYRKRWV
jgi:hypothetical protein